MDRSHRRDRTTPCFLAIRARRDDDASTSRMAVEWLDDIAGHDADLAELDPVLSRGLVKTVDRDDSSRTREDVPLRDMPNRRAFQRQVIRYSPSASIIAAPTRSTPVESGISCVQKYPPLSRAATSMMCGRPS